MLKEGRDKWILQSNSIALQGLFFVRFFPGIHQQLQEFSQVYLEGTLYPWISLLQKRSDIMFIHHDWQGSYFY